MDLKDIKQKKAMHKSIQTTQVHLYKVLHLVRLICGAKTQRLAAFGREGHETTNFLGSWEQSIYYLGQGGTYTGK